MCQDKFSFCLSSNLNLDIVCWMNTVQLQDQGDFARGGIGTGALDSEQSDTIQSMAGFVCPCRRAFYSLPPMPLFLGSCCVINNKIKGLDTKILALVQPDKYHSNCILSCPLAVVFKSTIFILAVKYIGNKSVIHFEFKRVFKNI